MFDINTPLKVTIHRITIKDKTHKNGIPTSLNMERRLYKMMRDA